MSTLSKVFVILVVVFSVAWMALTASLFALRVDYKDKLDKEILVHQTDVAKLKGEIAVLQGEVSTQKGAVSEARKENADLIGRLEAAIQDLTSWKSTYADLLGKHEKLTESLKNLEQQIREKDRLTAQMQSELLDYKAKLDTAVEDRYVFQQKYVEVNDELERLKKDTASLEEEHVRVLKELDEASTLIKQVRKTVVLPETPTVPVTVDGVVTAVSAKHNLLIISVGKDEGVSESMRMTVSRGPKYVGEIVVQKVERDWSSAVSNLELQQDRIQVGDRVQTKIY